MTGDQNPAPGPAPGVPIKVTPEILLQVLTTPPASGPAPFPAVPVDLPAPADIANGALFAAGNSGVPGDVESSGLEDLDRRRMRPMPCKSSRRMRPMRPNNSRGWALRRRPRGRRR